MMKRKKNGPLHPGKILESLFLEPLHMSQRALAHAIGVDSRRINDIVRGGRGITGDTAVRLAAFFGTSPEYWLSMQKHFELEIAKEELKDIVREIEPLTRADDRATPQ